MTDNAQYGVFGQRTGGPGLASRLYKPIMGGVMVDMRRIDSAISTLASSRNAIRVIRREAGLPIPTSPARVGTHRQKQHPVACLTLGRSQRLPYKGRDNRAHAFALPCRQPFGCHQHVVVNREWFASLPSI